MAQLIGATGAATVERSLTRPRKNTRTGARFEALDGLRGIAAISVVFFHTTWANHITSLPMTQNFYTAVDLFFILSGFVISSSYFDRLKNGTDVNAFLIRRLFRVYPLHLFVTLALVAIEAAKYVAIARGAHLEQTPFTGTNSVSSLVQNLLMLQGIGLSSATSWNFPSWTISSELVAYVMFAGASLLGFTQGPRSALAAGLAGLAAYALLAWTKGSLDFSFDFGIIRCLAGFSIGVAIDHMRRAGSLDWIKAQRRDVATALEAATLLTLMGLLWAARGPAIFFVIPCFGILVSLLQQEAGAVSSTLKNSYFRFLGVISYSLYLIHWPIQKVIVTGLQKAGILSPGIAGQQPPIDVDPWKGDVLLLIFLLIIIAAAYLTYRLVEEPGRALGRRLSRDKFSVTPQLQNSR